MRWQPEYGWGWLVGRWLVVIGAGVVLVEGVAGGGPDQPGALAIDPTETREVELDPRAQAELQRLLPGVGTESGRSPEDPYEAADADADGRGVSGKPDGDGGSDDDPDPRSGSGGSGGSDDVDDSGDDGDSGSGDGRDGESDSDSGGDVGD